MTRKEPTISVSAPTEAEQHHTDPFVTGTDQACDQARDDQDVGVNDKVPPKQSHDQSGHMDTSDYLITLFRLDKDAELRKEVARKLEELTAKEYLLLKVEVSRVQPYMLGVSWIADSRQETKLKAALRSAEREIAKNWLIAAVAEMSLILDLMLWESSPYWAHKAMWLIIALQYIGFSWIVEPWESPREAT